MAEQKRVLVAPLDWGLGHATRCIPIVRELLSLGHQVILAADGRAYDLLREEFPHLTMIRFKGYHPVYPDNANMVFAMGKQVPKFLFAILREHFQLKKIIKERSIDIVISDNRYGLRSRKITSVLITHQLLIRMPARMKWLEHPVNRLNHFFINRFDHCWVPDNEGPCNLGGELSHGPNLPGKVHYIGIVSRFQQDSINQGNCKHDLLALLSGPEPQRTILEKELKKQILPLQCRTLIVRGVTEENRKERLNDFVEVVSHLKTNELLSALQQSDAVVCRSGYSTLMELVALKKKAVIIPTPGQTEQEYLAERCGGFNGFVAQKQSHIDLKQALSALEKNAALALASDDKLSLTIKNLIELQPQSGN